MTRNLHLDVAHIQVTAPKLKHDISTYTVPVHQEKVDRVKQVANGSTGHEIPDFLANWWAGVVTPTPVRQPFLDLLQAWSTNMEAAYGVYEMFLDHINQRINAFVTLDDAEIHTLPPGDRQPSGPPANR